MPANFSTLGFPKRLCGTCIAGLALALSACAVSTPLTIDSTAERSGTRGSVIALVMPEPSEPTFRREFASALANALAAQNIAVSDDGDLLADFAIASGSAAIGAQLTPNRENSDTAETQWISAPRARKRFDECEAQILRGTLVLINRADGAMVYRGKAAMTECEFGQSDVDALAGALVADFISTLR